MNIKLPAMIDLDGRSINPAHIAFFLPARQQDTGEPDPSRTLVIPLRGKAYAVGLPPEEAASIARFPYLAEDGIAFNPTAGFRVQSTDYNGAATRLSLWDADSVFQNLRTKPETVAELYFGKGARLAKLNRTLLPKDRITVVLPYRDNEGRGFQAQAVLDNGRRVRTQEDVATVAQAHGFHYLDEGNVAARPAPISKSPTSIRALAPISNRAGFQIARRLGRSRVPATAYSSRRRARSPAACSFWDCPKAKARWSRMPPSASKHAPGRKGAQRPRPKAANRPRKVSSVHRVGYFDVSRFSWIEARWGASLAPRGTGYPASQDGVPASPDLRPSG